MDMSKYISVAQATELAKITTAIGKLVKTLNSTQNLNLSAFQVDTSFYNNVI